MPAAAESSHVIARNCPVCGGLDHRLWLTKGSLSIVRCLKCAMLFASPVERRLVDGSFYEQRADSYYLSADKLDSDYAPVRFARELRLFQNYCPRGNVLDVGCSTGGFLHQLTAQAPGRYRVAGTDVAGPALDYAESRGVPIRRGPFLEQDFGGQQFDAITFWAVLEHLAEPAAFLAKAAALLEPEGHLFILVPNMNSLAVRLLGARYRYIAPEHVNYFTPATLARLAAADGSVEFVASHSTHFNPIVLWQDWWRRTRDVSDAERASLLRRTTRWKQCSLLWPVQKLYAGAEWFLGKLSLTDNLVLVLRRRNPRRFRPILRASKTAGGTSAADSPSRLVGGRL